jgi:hypothetical protein
MNKRTQFRKDSDSSLENESSPSNNEASDFETTRTQFRISPQSNKEEKGALSDELTEEYIEDSMGIKKEDTSPIEETEKTITYDDIRPFKQEEDSNDGEEAVLEASEDSKESVTSDKPICVLCRNTIEELGIMESCFHHFCFACIKHWSEVRLWK